MAEEGIHELVTAQFGPNAAAYATSPTHSDERSLAELIEVVKPPSDAKLLDVATGAGHTALAFAPHVREVVAFDLTPSMLVEAGRLANERKLTNFSTREGKAESMPFADGEFDIVTVRTAPHHFADIDSFISESFRVLKSGGSFLMVDTTVPEDAQVAEEINRIEKLRDPSHVRNLAPSEWLKKVEAHGFKIAYAKVGQHAGGKKMEVGQWMDRIGTSEEVREDILGSFLDPTPELVDALDIERRDHEIWFTLPELILLSHKQ